MSTLLIAKNLNPIFSFTAELFAPDDKVKTEKIKPGKKNFSAGEKAVAYEATVQTNLPDYYPGDTVIITGSGWTPGETVTLNIVSDCGCTNETYVVTADADGNIYNADFVIQEWHLGASFVLTATGSNGNYAETTFTDSPKLGNINPITQVGIVCSGTSTNVTFNYTVNRGTNTSGSVAANIDISGLPAGVTVFSGLPNNEVTIGSSGYSNSFVLSVANTVAAGSYNFTLTADGPGPDDATGTGSLVVSELPNNVVNGFTGSTICSGVTGTLTFNAIDATFSTASTYTITYKDPANNIYNQTIPTASAYTFNVAVNPIVTTTYTLVSISNGSCTRTDNFGDATAQIVVNQPPTCSITGTDGPVCPSSTDNFSGPAGMSSYSWSLPTANGASISGSSTSQNVSVIAGSGCNTSYTLQLMITNANGCTSTCSQTVTVIDNTAPVITTCASAQDVNLNANCEVVVPDLTGSVVASDNCNGSVTITQSPSAGTIISSSHNATHTVILTATDACNNTATCSATLTAKDVTAPVIVTCPANKISSTDPGVCTKTYTASQIGTPAVTDNCTYTISWIRSDGAATINAPFNFGVTNITWRATDDAGNTATCLQTVTVNNVSTTTSVTVAPSSQQYSDKVTFVATVTPYNCTGAGFIGGTVTFKIGTLVMSSAPVASDGTATLENVPLLEDQLYDANLNDPMNPTNGPLKPGSKTVTACYASTDPDYTVTNPTAPLTVTCEDADITYNGPTYFTVNPSTLAGTVVLSNSVIDRNDGADTRGDIRNAVGTFWRDAIGVGGTVLGTANTPVGLVNPGNVQEGILTTSFNTTLSSSEASGGGRVYEVWSILNNYYCGQTPDYTPVTLAMPGQDFVTGGGYINMSNSAGTYAGTSGKRMNFGFVMKWNSSGKNLQGQVNVIFRRVVSGVTRVYQIKSNAINSMAVENVNNAGQPAPGTNITFRRATISTKANLRDITDPLNPISLGGNLSLIMTAWESTTVNTGALDRISVQLMSSGTTGLLFSSNWSGGATVWQTLDGGKIQVRNASTPPPGQSTFITKSAEMETNPEITPFNVKAFPNPTGHQFTLYVEGGSNEKVQVLVYDVVGRQVKKIERGDGSTPIRFGEDLKAGAYFVEVRQGDNRKTLKLVKQ